ncbi:MULTISPECIES: hypothetical protein [Protofrankia]|nr:MULTISPECIES: hypothetical protein [Protofrankia]
MEQLTPRACSERTVTVKSDPDAPGARPPYGDDLYSARFQVAFPRVG